MILYKLLVKIHHIVDFPLVLDYSDNESILRYGQLSKFTSVFSSCLFCEENKYSLTT